MNNIYETVIETPESDFTEDIFASNDDKQKIIDVINCVKDVRYGFIDKNTGEIHDDRDWIHNCDCLSKYYQTNFDPKITLKNKLGICLDQSIAIKYLLKRLHPEIECDIYALTKANKGHAVPCYCADGKFYYFENAWDKEKGLHGPFETRDRLEDYLKYIYYKNHKDDTPEECPVSVLKYEDYIKNQNLNESVIYFK